MTPVLTYQNPKKSRHSYQRGQVDGFSTFLIRSCTAQNDLEPADGSESLVAARAHRSVSPIYDPPTTRETERLMTHTHYSSPSRPSRPWWLSAVTPLLLLALLAAACTSPSASPDTTTPDIAVDDTTTTTTALTDTTTTEMPQEDEPHRLASIEADYEGALLGISTGLSRAERAPRFRQLEQDAGRQFDIGHVFHAWDKAIPTEDDLMHLEDGRILMISWNGTDTIEIANGDHDDWIRTQATAVRDLEEPVLLRWLWEMDGNRRRAWVHSGPDYVAAWLQVRSIFDEVGANNAQFVWCPNEFLFWDGGDPEPWYPGDDNVDWLCADGYNWPASTEDPEWITIDKIFEDFVAWAAPKNLPIIIGETGSNEAEAGAKADWLRSVPELLETELPEVDAVVYFDKDFRSFGHPDWRLDTTDDSYQAWIEMSNDPWFNATAE